MASPTTSKLAVAKLVSSGLGEEHLASLNLTLLEPAEMAGIHPAFKAAPAICFNYMSPFDPTQPLTPRPKWPAFRRYRYLADVQDAKGKLMRYTQEPDSGCCAYFPTLVDWRAIAADTETSIVITEGELKAAKCCAVGLPCIGLGGVWNFLSTRAETGFLPELEAFDWVKRRVYIIYDSDASTNPNVVQALNALAHELELRGALSYTVMLPSLIVDGKTGLDDYLKANPDRAAFTRFILQNRQSLTLAKPLWDLNEEVILSRNPHVVIEVASGSLLDTRAFASSLYANRLMPELKLKEDGTVSTKTVQVAPAWLKWPLRREVAGITYAPGEPSITAGQEWNCWKGWGTEPIKGDVTPFLTLVHHLFKGASKEIIEWFMRWCAFPIINPGTKMYTSAVLHGTKHGTGKSFIGYSLGRIYGDNFTEIRQGDLHNRFNGWAKNKQLVLGDDVTGSGNSEKRDLADMLKGMITQKELRVNVKFIPDYTVPDHVNYIFTSNQPDAFFLEDDDRRFFVHEVDVDPLPMDFYQSYEAWIYGEGGPALHHYLLNYKLGNFDHRSRALDTPSKNRMIDVGRSDLAVWCDRLKDDHERLLHIGKTQLFADLYTSKELIAIYDPTNAHKISSNGMAKALRRAGFRQVGDGIPIKWARGNDRYFIVRHPERWSRATLAQVRQHLNLNK